MESGTEHARHTLSNFAHSVTKLDDTIATLLTTLKTLRTATPGDDDANSVVSEMDALSRARLHITLTYTVNTLFCMYLKAQGIEPSSHPISTELSRVQDAFLRLRKVEAGKSTKHVPAPRRNVRENVAKLKLAEKELAMLIFPEENRLFKALNSSSELADGDKITFDDDGDKNANGDEERVMKNEDEKDNDESATPDIPPESVETTSKERNKKSKKAKSKDDSKSAENHSTSKKDGTEMSKQKKRKKKQKSKGKMSREDGDVTNVDPVSSPSRPEKRKAEELEETAAIEASADGSDKRKKKKKKREQGSVQTETE